MIRIEIHKKARRLDVINGSEVFRSFPVALGFSPDDDKEVEGDGKTPEGMFYVFAKNAQSKFHLSLGISYPSIEDAKRGLSKNLISSEEASEISKAVDEKQMPPQKTALGGEIYIHGGGIESDWTKGCVALSNKEMTELFDLIPKGAEVRIFP
jgi:murein L,D-transpeptidase YafK